MKAKISNLGYKILADRKLSRTILHRLAKGEDNFTEGNYIITKINSLDTSINKNK
jgi:hypothetical protein